MKFIKKYFMIYSLRDKRKDIIELNDGYSSYICEYGHIQDYRYTFRIIKIILAII